MLQQLKKDILDRGFIIHENKLILGPFGASSEDLIRTVIEKKDTDGVNWNATFDIPHYYYGGEKHVGYLTQAVKQLEDSIQMRHNTIIHQCTHDYIEVNGTIVCRLCMGKFGQKIVITMMNN